MDPFQAALQSLIKEGGWRGIFEVLLVLAVTALWRAYRGAVARHERTLREMADVGLTMDDMVRVVRAIRNGHDAEEAADRERHHALGEGELRGGEGDRGRDAPGRRTRDERAGEGDHGPRHEDADGDSTRNGEVIE